VTTIRVVQSTSRLGVPSADSPRSHGSGTILHADSRAASESPVSPVSVSSVPKAFAVPKCADTKSEEEEQAVPTSRDPAGWKPVCMPLVVEDNVDIEQAGGDHRTTHTPVLQAESSTEAANSSGLPRPDDERSTSAGQLGAPSPRRSILRKPLMIPGDGNDHSAPTRSISWRDLHGDQGLVEEHHYECSDDEWTQEEHGQPTCCVVS